MKGWLESRSRVWGLGSIGFRFGGLLEGFGLSG